MEKGSILGIMEDEKIKSTENIEDFTNKDNNGYGVILGAWSKFHGNVYGGDGYINKYAEQFVIDKEVLITMELDMTQTRNNNGILSITLQNKQQDKIGIIRTDGVYTNIVYDNVDITKRYRAILAIGYHSDEWTEFLA